MHLNGADWMVESWESIVVLFDIVGLCGFRIMNSTVLVYKGLCGGQHH